mmetsp:Transcript_3048/g.7932  ORF Transcript_3048/g.7932 Transcript_3048/m.7932 type:complete len:587 (-) Transcript_3048:253-2013(-)
MEWRRYACSSRNSSRGSSSSSSFSKNGRSKNGANTKNGEGSRHGQSKASDNTPTPTYDAPTTERGESERSAEQPSGREAAAKAKAPGEETEPNKGGKGEDSGDAPTPTPTPTPAAAAEGELVQGRQREQSTEPPRDSPAATTPAKLSIKRKERDEQRPSVNDDHNDGEGDANSGPDDDFDELYLVFEYVDTDLYKLIMSPQYLTTEHIQTFLYQMLTGIKYIHSSSVIHRDLKPANILLNEDCSLKICDFGLARIVSSETMSPRGCDDSSAEAQSQQQQQQRQQRGEEGEEGGGGGGTPTTESSADTSDRAKREPQPQQPRSQQAQAQPRAQAQAQANGESIPKTPPKPGLTRQLTKHVVTRWYRAPELILIQPYTSAVDIWSAGCILAELLSMQEGSVPGYQDRVPLFPGGSCYPLSGGDGAGAPSDKGDERLDQLSVIFSVIGTPSEEDASTVGGAREYVAALVRKKRGRPLESLYPAADPHAIDLLRRMLRFNPRKRCTAGEALEHDFLRGVRRKEMEKSSDQPLVGPDFLETNHVDMSTLKRRTYEEVQWYRKREERELLERERERKEEDHGHGREKKKKEE